MGKMENQGCGESPVLQAQQDHEESLDSKGKPATLGSPDRRVMLALQGLLEHQVDQDMRVIPVLQELWDDLDPQAILVLQVQLDHQVLLVNQEWV